MGDVDVSRAQLTTLRDNLNMSDAAMLLVIGANIVKASSLRMLSTVLVLAALESPLLQPSCLSECVVGQSAAISRS